MNKLDNFYMDVAKLISAKSYANRLKVGAVIVTCTGSMFPGYNGTLSGFPNVCEKEDGTTNNSITVHAEQNALYKMLREGVSSDGATLYTTHSCCEECAKMMIAAGIRKVVYGEVYRDPSPLSTLELGGVKVVKFAQS